MNINITNIIVDITNIIFTYYTLVVEPGKEVKPLEDLSGVQACWEY